MLSSAISTIPALIRLAPTALAAANGDPRAGIELARFAISNPEVASLLSSVGQSSLGLLSSAL